MANKLFMWLCVVITCLDVSAGIIAPRLMVVPQEHLVVQSRDNFTLRCESPQPINWTYPALHSNGTRNSTINIKNTMSENLYYPYVSTLEVVDAYYMDTGYYSCFLKGHVDIQNSDIVSKIYVFVSDPVILIVPDDSFIMGCEYKSVVIPCRPTSPDIEVTLVNDYDEVESLDNARITFDPRIGFQMNFLSLEDASTYYCHAKRDDVTQTTEVFLHILPATDFVVAPVIQLETEVGSRFKLRCSASLARDIKFSLDWNVPNKVAVKEKRLTKGVTVIEYSDYKTGYKTLEVQSARRIDSGAYKCVVIDHNGHKNSTTFNISVMDKN